MKLLFSSFKWSANQKQNTSKLPKFGAMAACACLLSGCFEQDPKDTITELLSASSAELTSYEVNFDGCELKVDAQQSNQSTDTTKIVFRADLEIFELTKGRIRQASNNKFELVLDRKKSSERLLDQAEKIAAALPDDFESHSGQLQFRDGQAITTETRVETAAGEKLSRKQLSQMLDTKGGRLVFRLTSVSINGAPIKAHEDAPGFLEFAQRVDGLPSPQTAIISTFYRVTEGDDQELLSGAVVLPNELTFKVSSFENAKALGKALYDYHSQECKG